MFNQKVLSLATGLALLTLAEGGAVAQELEEVIVTGVAREGVSKLEASVSVSSLTQEDIEKIAPRSVAEIFRSLPGIPQRLFTPCHSAYSTVVNKANL